MNRERYLCLVESVKPRAIPQPRNREAWPIGQGPRVWTPDRIRQLSEENERYRRAKTPAGVSY